MVTRIDTGETIDVRDVIARFEALEESLDEDDIKEQEDLKDLLDSLAGMGDDEEWRGAWYPITLIADSFFTSYAQEFAEDIGAIKRDMDWPTNCIDWGQAANELRSDYSEVEYQGVTYWYR